MDARRCLLVCVLSSAFMVACGARASKERNTKPYRLVCVKGQDPNHDDRTYFEEDVDYSRCTHVIHHNENYYNYINETQSYYHRMRLKSLLKLVAKLRESNPNITQLLSWNGWVTASKSEYFYADNPEKRAETFKNLTSILTECDLDGVDLTWRNSHDCDTYYYSNYQSQMLPKDNFTDYVKALREELDKEGFVLTATVNGRTDQPDYGYDAQKLSQYLDFINLMGYDLVAYNEYSAKHNAPINSLPEEKNPSSVQFSLKYWLDSGADPHKMVLGVTPLGRKVGLSSEKSNGPLAHAYYWDGNYPFLRMLCHRVDYSQMCFHLNKNPKWTVVRNEHWQAPYAFNNDTWISYDDEISVGLKMDLVLAKDLGGAMIDHYEMDADQSGLCDRKYPLSSVMLGKLTGTATEYIVPTKSTRVTTTATSPRTFPTTTTTRPSTVTSHPAPRFRCRRGGLYEYPGDCTKYYECVPKGSGYRVTVHECDEGLGFEPRVGNCVSKSRVRNC